MLGLGAGITYSSPLQKEGPPFSLQLSGTDDHVRVGFHASLQPTRLTVAGWVNLDTIYGSSGWKNTQGGTGLTQVIVGCIGSGGFGIQIVYSGTPLNPVTKILGVVNVTDDGGGSADYLRPSWGGKTSSNTSALPLHEIRNLFGWVHIALTYNGAIASLYINGSKSRHGGGSNSAGTGDLDASADQTVDSGVTGKNVRYTINIPLMLGADGVNTGTNAAELLQGGLLDDFAVWSAPLDDAAIARIYDNGHAGLNLAADNGDYDNASDLEGFWRFEEGSGSTIADSSSNSNTGTMVNNPVFNANTSEQ